MICGPNENSPKARRERQLVRMTTQQNQASHRVNNNELIIQTCSYMDIRIRRTVKLYTARSRLYQRIATRDSLESSRRDQQNSLRSTAF